MRNVFEPSAFAFVATGEAQSGTFIVDSSSGTFGFGLRLVRSLAPRAPGAVPAQEAVHRRSTVPESKPALGNALAMLSVACRARTG
jgi:hypothetical protein